MGFISLKSWRARSAAQTEAVAALKLQLVEALALGPDDALTVNAIACADPGCPDLETIVLVMRVGEPTRAVKIRRPIEAVELADVLGVVLEERRLRAGRSERARPPLRPACGERAEPPLPGARQAEAKPTRG
ncbi:hypothetical protein GCM10007887_03330 [Methylobacterium haplocladii]|uniref:Nitrate reductase n=1 Tax=Methylobacterium haplocladii TaxID=1176176 RepID=A0A512ILT1_9HYPH|nr:hypothetical protein MHA02_10610 [Methylobacterium haplocladii]GJD83926.1 hypothetical protein HPGCJGGD_1800 [Methylobacterium haplocladii]GLS57677.1 hypothetical protein GCM10007887_03330 [Methylobacterium haplocladii]